MNKAKIYFNEALLILAQNGSGEPFDSEIHLNNPSEDEVATIIEQMQEDNALATLITSDDFESLKHSVERHFKIIQAGGGIVINKDGAVLLIFRRGKWDLPKGKLDEGESIETCAMREVKEETGLSHLSLRKLFTITRHVYKEKNKLILKETFWYLMNYPGNEILVPQEEESITRAEWVLQQDIEKYLNNTFPSIKEILGQRGLQP